MLFSKNASERLVFVDLFVISRIPEFPNIHRPKFANLQQLKFPKGQIPEKQQNTIKKKWTLTNQHPFLFNEIIFPIKPEF